MWTLLLSWCFSGSLAVGLPIGSSRDTPNSVLGNALALVSSWFYAVYTLILRLYLRDGDRYSMGQVLGAVGVINIFVFGAGFPLFEHACRRVVSVAVSEAVFLALAELAHRHKFE